MTFSNMREPGAYTIIEVYTNHCDRCKVLEAKFPTLLRKRGDIVIKRVREFSGRISFDSQQAQEKWSNHQDSMMDFYQVKSTPHIKIYDGNGNSLTKDQGSKKSGTGLLTEILKANS